MRVEIEYGTKYIADTVARQVFTASNGQRVRAAKRVAKLLKLADAKIASNS